ncbi:hypothetical protein [Flagellimonas myxillae]|uniref:hypothetical protein n=1 Tax=Flagellimonas myxillae TaxID=2942214 RepID=UPI00201F6390|nr:hypothetical protein [Muricauda myxillae]MCL6264910.1 hypothetical protein [Muricauda myxillae]
MKNILLIFLFPIAFTVYGQTSIQNQINQIKERYYGLNKSKLTRVTIKNHHFYLQNDKIKKVVSEIDTIRYEFYYDLDWIPHYAYFIYTTNSESANLKENRYYFGHENNLIRWIDSNKSLVVLDKSHCLKRLKLIAHSKDLLTIYNNNLQENKNPEYSSYVNTINSKILELTPKIIDIDTVEILDIPDDAYFSHKVEFKNRFGTKIKSLSFTGGDHSTETKTSFFNNKGNIICTIFEGNDVFGHSYTSKMYYQENKLFRTIRSSSTIGDWGDYNCRDFRHTYINKIFDSGY